MPTSTDRLLWERHREAFLDQVGEVLGVHLPIPTPIPDDPHGVYLTCFCGWVPGTKAETWKGHFQARLEDYGDAT